MAVDYSLEKVGVSIKMTVIETFIANPWIIILIVGIILLFLIFKYGIKVLQFIFYGLGIIAIINYLGWTW